MSDATTDAAEEEQPALSEDLLRGADQIATFVYGAPGQRQKVYHAIRKDKLPVFRMNGIIHARKSTILKWIADRERAAAA